MSRYLLTRRDRLVRLVNECALRMHINTKGSSFAGSIEPRSTLADVQIRLGVSKCLGVLGL